MIDVTLKGHLVLKRWTDVPEGPPVSDDDIVKPQGSNAHLRSLGLQTKAIDPITVIGDEWLETPWRLAAIPQVPDQEVVDQRPRRRGAVNIELPGEHYDQSIEPLNVSFGVDGSVTIYVGGWVNWDPQSVRDLFARAREFYERGEKGDVDA